MLNQKGFIAQVLILLLLGVGIVAGVWLVQNRTNLFPKAASNPISGPIVNPDPISTPQPGSGSSGGGNRRRSTPTIPTPTPTPATQVIKQFRFAENPVDLKISSWQVYAPGVVATHIFSDSSLGVKSIFVQFGDANGQIIMVNGQEYLVNSIELVNIAQGGLIPTFSPTPVSKESNPNCPISDPTSYSISTLKQMCTSYDFSRMDLKHLYTFDNATLIEIARSTGNMGEFLAQFSGERLIGVGDYQGSGFSLDILRQLPEWRKIQLPGYIYDQIK